MNPIDFRKFDELLSSLERQASAAIKKGNTKALQSLDFKVKGLAPKGYQARSWYRALTGRDLHATSGTVVLAADLRTDRYYKHYSELSYQISQVLEEDEN